MWLVYCSLALLVWLPGILHAQETPQFCSAPTLRNGYFVPMKESYQLNEKIIYACENGFKPEVDVAQSMCENGQWSPQPQCIVQETPQVCSAPSLRNGYFVPTKDSYQQNEKIIYACDYGFKPAVDVAQSMCENGQWSPQPQCIEAPQFCSAPTLENGYFVPIKVSYQLNEKIIYVCENGFKPTVDVAQSMCENGQWSPQPQCIVYSPGLIEGNRKPNFVPVENCGELPFVVHGLVEQSENLALRVSCQRFYKLDGPEKVVCYSSNKWSEVPVCKANYCSVDTAAYQDLVPDGVKYVVNGEQIKLLCKDIFYYEAHRVVRCRNGKATVSECCNKIQRGVLARCSL